MRASWFVELQRPRFAVAVAGAPPEIAEVRERTYELHPELGHELALNPDSSADILRWALWRGFSEWDHNLLEVAVHPNAQPGSMMAIAGEILDNDADRAHEALLRRADVPSDVVRRLFTLDQHSDSCWTDDDPFLPPFAYLENPRSTPGSWKTWHGFVWVRIRSAASGRSGCTSAASCPAQPRGRSSATNSAT